jgi:hypothetical protein
MTARRGACGTNATCAVKSGNAWPITSSSAIFRVGRKPLQLIAFALVPVAAALGALATAIMIILGRIALWAIGTMVVLLIRYAPASAEEPIYIATDNAYCITSADAAEQQGMPAMVTPDMLTAYLQTLGVPVWENYDAVTHGPTRVKVSWGWGPVHSFSWGPTRRLYYYGSLKDCEAGGLLPGRHDIP